MDSLNNSRIEKRHSADGARYTLMAVIGMTIAAVFVSDLLLPLGVAAGVAYVVPVLLSIRAVDSRLTLAVAGLCIVLIVIGYYESTPAGASWMVLANRGLSIGVVCAAAMLLVVRARVLNSLKGTRDRLQAVLDTAPDGIIVIDENGIIESFNYGAEQLFGFTSSEVLGKNVSSLMPSPEAESHDGYLRHYQDTGEKRIIGSGREVIGKTRDGTLIPLRLAVGEMAVGERRYTGILHDMRDFQRVQKDSLEDAVTGLLNRRAFDRTLAAALSRNATSLLFVDIDRLKLINDGLGHSRGDEAITATARLIKSSLRTTEGCPAARFGGDEFAVILPGITHSVAVTIAQRISLVAQKALAEIHPQSGVSIGVASAAMGTVPDELLRQTDEALYRAKQQRGCVSD